MKNIRIYYRHEPDGAWIGTSPDTPGFVGHGDTYEQARDRVQEGLPWFLEDRDLMLVHIAPSESQQEPTSIAGRVSFALTVPLARPSMEVVRTRHPSPTEA